MSTEDASVLIGEVVPSGAGTGQDAGVSDRA
jgi:hypothetical protein